MQGNIFPASSANANATNSNTIQVESFIVHMYRNLWLFQIETFFPGENRKENRLNKNATASRNGNENSALRLCPSAKKTASDWIKGRSIVIYVRKNFDLFSFFRFRITSRRRPFPLVCLLFTAPPPPRPKKPSFRGWFITEWTANDSYHIFTDSRVCIDFQTSSD